MVVNLFNPDGSVALSKPVLIVGPQRCRRCGGVVTPREVAAYTDERGSRHEDCWVLDHLTRDERLEMRRAERAAAQSAAQTVNAVNILFS